MRAPWWTQPGEKHPFCAPTVPRALLDSHIAQVRAGALPGVISNAVPPARTPLAMATLQHGLFGELLGAQTELYPMECLQRFEGEMPALWLYHGKDDSAVLVEDTVAFGEVVRRFRPEARVLVTVTEGEHGFDAARGMGVGAEWCREGTEFVTSAWLR